MKKLLTIVISAVILACGLLPSAALAENAPALKSISFNGARLDSKFSSDELNYTITLDEPTKTPTLKSYKVSGSADIFVTYSVNDSNCQDGIIVKIEHENGAVYYNFKYSNGVTYAESGNNYLKAVSCPLGEVYPKIDEDTTNYRLYIPADMTEINLSVATQELSAIAEVPSTVKLNSNQEPVIPITVTASNGESRAYSFKVKRLRKDTAQVQEIMKNPNHKSIVYGELFYQRPEFLVATICVGAGLIVVLCGVFVAKRIMIKVGDDEEVEFFEI